MNDVAVVFSHVLCVLEFCAVHVPVWIEHCEILHTVTDQLTKSITRYLSTTKKHKEDSEGRAKESREHGMASIH